jgi:hypothetical protein
MDPVQRGLANGVLISPRQGFASTNLEFLRHYDYIKSVSLINSRGIDISALKKLSNLERLIISGNQQPVDLRWFPCLKELSIEWHPRVALDGAPASLEKLHLRRYRPKSKNLVELPPFPLLSELSIVQSPIESLEGVEKFRNLRSLEISYLSKLKRIGAIANLDDGRLEQLICEYCRKIEDYEKLQDLANLKVLRLNHCAPIRELSFVKGLRSLQDFRFVGTDVLDGDISPLLDHKSIRSVAFTNKRHFSHSERAISDAIRGRQ